ncbi:hypothetical protein YC2023_060946 [Brassica napus]
MSLLTWTKQNHPPVSRQIRRNLDGLLIGGSQGPPMISVTGRSGHFGLITSSNKKKSEAKNMKKSGVLYGATAAWVLSKSNSSPSLRRDSNSSTTAAWLSISKGRGHFCPICASVSKKVFLEPIVSLRVKKDENVSDYINDQKNYMSRHHHLIDIKSFYRKNELIDVNSVYNL